MNQTNYSIAQNTSIGVSEALTPLNSTTLITQGGIAVAIIIAVGFLLSIIFGGTTKLIESLLPFMLKEDSKKKVK